MAINSITGAVGLKLMRAEHHIRDLKRRITEHLAVANIRLVYITNHQAQESTVEIKQDIPIPDEFSAIIGDAVHNMRAALDILTYQALASRFPENDAGLKHIGFPIASSQEAHKATLESARIKLAGNKVFNAYKAVKAYPGGNDELCALHRLDITDKHRAIVTTSHALILNAAALAKIDPQMVNLTDDPFEPTKFFGTNIVARLRYSYVNRADRRAQATKPIVERKTKVQPRFEVCFGVREPFAGQDVVLALMHMHNATRVACLMIFDALKDQASPPAVASGK